MSRQSPEFVLGFQEAQARTRGGAQIMGTEIEGAGGRLARLQRLAEWRQKDVLQERRFLEAFFELREKFGEADEVNLKDRFLGLKNAVYKSPTAFLLAEYALRAAQGAITQEGIRMAREIALAVDQNMIAEEDILRYCRLLVGN